ncbi:hypothetical protein HT136_12770 [Novosphingobium profundi]|uniref:cupin domain-containing protein n=1 Tax=Novosphingobium profundi TaxID=1774954 RepID=UPI001BDB181F|nr:hypothetical protein [Novosphingobium profundi]MBT0669236.1 hypothetical protein [Novosphingobium profundi]
MARAHIEFVQTQSLAWSPRADGALVKVLSRDPATGEETALVRYRAGFTGAANRDEAGAEEFFVLSGTLEIDGRARGHHAYGFLPQGSGLGARHSARGADLLVFRHAPGDRNAQAGRAEVLAHDTPAMEWDVSTYNPGLSHLRLARKVLRLGPGDSGRTFLLAGMPHGLPRAEALPAEWHDHAEEMFMLQGTMWAPEGCQRPGAYFYRPPRIVHGPHVSRDGFFQIMRSPGANEIVTHWTNEAYPLPLEPAFRPILPEGSPEEWARSFEGEVSW